MNTWSDLRCVSDSRGDALVRVRPAVQQKRREVRDVRAARAARELAGSEVTGAGERSRSCRWGRSWRVARASAPRGASQVRLRRDVRCRSAPNLQVFLLTG
jgi:hypothetical protein